MKVGIITYHGAYNYGSALQAFSLFHAVKSEGHEAEIINYRTDRQDRLYRMYTKPNGLMDMMRNAQTLVNRRKMKEHRAGFDRFIAEHTVLSGSEIRTPEALRTLNSVYDCFICGSDQVWNPNCVDFDVSYLLDFVTDKKKCFSYAPSIASEALGEAWHEIFRDELTGFSDLSVREESGAKIIADITGRQVETVLDPVFLLDRADWRPFIKESSQAYILGYFIGDIPGMRDYAEALGRRYSLPVVVINKNLRDLRMKCVKRYESGPEEFVDLVANAKAVCTNSFHAMAFSLIFDREFHVFVDNVHANTARRRITDLLRDLGMEDRLVDSRLQLLPPMSDPDFDHHDKLDSRIRFSKRYLQNALARVDAYGKGRS